MSTKPGDYVIVVDPAYAMEKGQLIRVRDVDGYGRFHLFGFDGPWNPERFKEALTYVELADRVKVLEAGAFKSADEILQTLGKALGYPWYRDDQKNFPGATEADGVCTGDHVAESIAVSAANKIQELSTERAELLEALKAVLEEWVDRGYEERLLPAARATIAKVEGPKEL